MVCKEKTRICLVKTLTAARICIVDMFAAFATFFVMQISNVNRFLLLDQRDFRNYEPCEWVNTSKIIGR